MRRLNEYSTGTEHSTLLKLLEAMNQSLGEMRRFQQARHMQTPSVSKVPRAWQKFTGATKSVIMEYQVWETQAERTHFSTWKAFYETFED